MGALGSFSALNQAGEVNVRAEDGSGSLRVNVTAAPEKPGQEQTPWVYYQGQLNKVWRM